MSYCRCWEPESPRSASLSLRRDSPPGLGVRRQVKRDAAFFASSLARRQKSPECRYSDPAASSEARGC
jgi:hypothetical protein